MKTQILETLTEKHKRCSQGLGVFKNDLLEGKDSKEVLLSLLELEKKGFIEYHDTVYFGRLYKLTKKYKKEKLI